MGLKNQMGQGPNYVPAYQTSGTPFVTSSQAAGTNSGPTRVSFPYVTKVVTVQNLDDDTNLRVAFSRSGSFAVGETLPSGGTKPKKTQFNDQGNNYFVVPKMGTTDVMSGVSQVTLDVRCKEVWLMSDHASNTVNYSLYAGLTGIDKQQFPELTASNGFKGTG